MAGIDLRSPAGTTNAASASYPNSSGTATVVPRPYFIDARDYGVVADNQGNYTTQLQAAINAAKQTIAGLTGSDAPSMIVQLPVGRIKTGGLTLPNNVILQGHGRGSTYLTSTGLSTGAVLSLATGGEAEITVRDLGIIVNSNTAEGISFIQTGIASILGDANHHIENVVIVGGQRALQIYSNTECRVINVLAYRQTVPLGIAAIQIDGTDQMVERCTVAQVQYVGTGQGGSAFRAGTSNSRFVNCKVFGGSATVNGTQQEAFALGGSRNQVIGLEVQDYAGAAGINAGSDNTFIGGLVDSCQGGGAVLGNGGPVIRGMRFANRIGGAFTMPYALSLSNGSGADIDCTVESVANLFSSGAQTGLGSRIRVNGEGATQSVTYAATVTPDPAAATVNQITLTGNITLANPSSAFGNVIRPGQRVAFLITQDATGGRTVSWGTSYVVNNAPSTAANAVSRIEFEYDGTKWREVDPAAGTGGGGAAGNVVSKTANYTAANGDIVLANAAGGAFAVTTPSAAVNNKITVKKTDSSANGVTITPASGTIDGAATLVLSAQYVSRDVVCDGTNWFVV